MDPEEASRSPSLPDSWEEDAVLVTDKKKCVTRVDQILPLISPEIPSLDASTIASSPEAENETKTQRPLKATQHFSPIFQKTLEELQSAKDEQTTIFPPPSSSQRRKSSASSRKSSGASYLYARLHRRSTSPSGQNSSSSSDEANERLKEARGSAFVRSQHSLSHERAERLVHQKTRPGKVDSAIQRRQRSLGRVSAEAREKAAAAREALYTRSLESAVRQEAYALDGEPGWALKPLRRRSSDSFVISAKNYNELYEDSLPMTATVNWETLRQAREKCTEWLVKHVLLPETTRRPVGRTIKTRMR